MTPHRFNPLAAVAGAAMIGAGTLVAAFAAEHFDGRAVLATASTGVVIGLCLLPWPRRSGR